MKKLLVLVATLAIGCVFAESQSYEQSVAERLKPAGNVCIEGVACETASVAASSAESSGPRSGEDVFTASCNACHGSGLLNSPKLGDAVAWAPRIAQGTDTLYEHAIVGFNLMPAKGGNPSLSDEEVMAAVDHMVAAAQ